MGVTYKAAEPEPDEQHCPCTSLIVAIFERALSDCVGTPESTAYNCDAKNIGGVRRRARRWLFSRSQAPGSAIWWSELGDLEYLHGVIKEAVRVCEAEDKRFLIGRREHGTGRAKFSRDENFERKRSILSWH